MGLEPAASGVTGRAFYSGRTGFKVWHTNPRDPPVVSKVYWLTISRRGETGGESPRKMKLRIAPF